MQEEIEHKTVNLAISTTKLSARTLLRGMQFLLRQYDKHASQGKQSMKRLVRQNRGVTNVEIQKTGIKDFDRYTGGSSMNKLLSCHYNMDTNRVEARFADGTTLAIDCIAIEDEYGNTPAQRAELDWLLYNKPLEYAQLVLGGEIEHYLLLGCDHGRLED